MVLPIYDFATAKLNRKLASNQCSVPTIKNPPDAPSNRGRRGWCTLVHFSTREEGRGEIWWEKITCKNVSTTWLGSAINIFHFLYMDSRVGTFGWSKWHLALPSWRISTILTCEKGEAKTEGPIHERRTRPSEPMKVLQKLSKHFRAFSRIVWKYECWN